ncbi:hypothetical protein NS359_15180 [Curtobacterium oceanosedimentum]|uniref:Uncharacterized protein n=1 Tax=Curtobacterium oceanosedimentum TaxID=465820 RepID=A0A147DM48_9MICO|nr:hypothetical protein NS359_15180 [Curtobacterium oceanosedimentum]
MRTLVHTTKASTSLLRHLDLDNRLRWVTSGWYEPGNLVSTDGLTMMSPGDPQEGDQAYRLFAKTAEEILPMRHAWVDFETWWKQIVIRDQVGREYSRRQIVLFLANKYGGAHYDRPGAADQALLDGSAFGWFYQDEPLFLGENRVLLSMRTIASEVEVVFADEQNALLVPDLPR